MTNPLNELFQVPQIDFEIEEDPVEEPTQSTAVAILPEPPPPPKTALVVKEGTGIDPDTDEDYTLARNTYKSLINKGNEAVNDIHELAKELEHPRAYEVLATLMKQVTDTTSALFELQKNRVGMQNGGEKKKDDPSQPPINVEKAVFVGTPAEMLRQLNGPDSQS